MNCEACGTVLTPKNRPLLFFVGLAMAASLVLGLFSLWLLLPALALTVVGVYLMLWSTRGKGQWCRTCKKAPLL